MSNTTLDLAFPECSKGNLIFHGHALNAYQCYPADPVIPTIPGDKRDVVFLVDGGNAVPNIDMHLGHDHEK